MSLHSDRTVTKTVSSWYNSLGVSTLQCFPASLPVFWILVIAVSSPQMSPKLWGKRWIQIPHSGWTVAYCTIKVLPPEKKTAWIYGHGHKYVQHNLTTWFFFFRKITILGISHVVNPMPSSSIGFWLGIQYPSWIPSYQPCLKLNHNMDGYPY